MQCEVYCYLFPWKNNNSIFNGLISAVVLWEYVIQ